MIEEGRHGVNRENGTYINLPIPEIDKATREVARTKTMSNIPHEDTELTTRALHSLIEDFMALKLSPEGHLWIV